MAISMAGIRSGQQGKPDAVLAPCLLSQILQLRCFMVHLAIGEKGQRLLSQRLCLGSSASGQVRLTQVNGDEGHVVVVARLSKAVLDRLEHLLRPLPKSQT